MRVVNSAQEDYDIYVGRPSKWGNPFIIGIDGTREEVLLLYEVYLFDNKKLLAQLPELKGKILGCHCKPSFDCHGDLLSRLANGFQMLPLEMK